MGKENSIPQVEVERANRGEQKARYTAYVKRLHKLKIRVKADKAGGAMTTQECEV